MTKLSAKPTNERCKESVYPSDRDGSFYPHQCERKAWKDGYCKQHHPDSVKERNEKARQRHEQRWEQRNRLEQKQYDDYAKAYHAAAMAEIRKEVKALPTYNGMIDREQLLAILDKHMKP